MTEFKTASVHILSASAADRAVIQSSLYQADAEQIRENSFVFDSNLDEFELADKLKKGTTANPELSISKLKLLNWA